MVSVGKSQDQDGGMENDHFSIFLPCKVECSYPFSYHDFRVAVDVNVLAFPTSSSHKTVVQSSCDTDF